MLKRCNPNIFRKQQNIFKTIEFQEEKKLNIVIIVQDFSHTSLISRLQITYIFVINCCDTFTNPPIPPPTQAHPVIFWEFAIERSKTEQITAAEWKLRTQ